jgi:hypothetical protein
VKNAQKLESNLKQLVETARTHYKSCEYDEALSILNSALNKAICGEHIKSINKKITKVKNAQTLQSNLEKLVETAYTQYKSCEYDKAISILNDALDRAVCGKHLVSLRNKIKHNKKAKSYEEKTKALFAEAKNLNSRRDYAGALAKMQQAYDHTQCDRYKDSLTDMMAKIKGKTKEKLSTQIPYVVGKNVELAQQLIRGAGLVPFVTKDKSPPDESKANKVYSQDPRGKTKIKQGSGVKLYAYGRYNPPDEDFTGSWSGTAVLSVNVQGQVKRSTNKLQFSVDRGNNARGKISHEREAQNLSGRVTGENITLTGEKHYDEAISKVTIKGAFQGNGAVGNWWIRTPDMECVMYNLFNPNNKKTCPITTYRGTWSATRR